MAWAALHCSMVWEALQMCEKIGPSYGEEPNLYALLTKCVSNHAQAIMALAVLRDFA